MIPFASQPIDAPPDGVYHDIPAHEYHGWRAWGSSSIVELNTKSLAELHAKMNQRTEANGAMYFGTLAHEYVLEPEDFEDRDLIEVESLKRDWTGTGRESKRTLTNNAQCAGETVLGFVREYAPATPIGAGWLEDFKAMRAAIDANPHASELLADPDRENTEVSLVWTDPDTGLKCKARIDRIGEEGPVDYKTTGSVEPVAVERVFSKLLYPERVWHYACGLHACGLADHPMKQTPRWVVATKDEPYFAVVRDIPGEWWTAAAERMRAWLKWIGIAELRNDWPGPPQIGTCQPPGWLMQLAEVGGLVPEDPWTETKRMAANLAARRAEADATEMEHNF